MIVLADCDAADILVYGGQLKTGAIDHPCQSELRATIGGPTKAVREARR